MTTSPHPADPELAKLVSAAQAGSSVAWSGLVDRFDRLLRGVARSYRLPAHDVDDVVQATWVKLYEHIDGLRDTSAIAGWLTTTVRRQSLRILQQHVREQPTAEPERVCESHEDGPEPRLLASERRLALTRALATLPERQRRLMTLIASDEGGNYEEIGATLDMPIGSIGPIRARSLARLQHHPELREFATAG